MPKKLTFGSFLLSEGIKRRVARERVNDWDIFSLPYHKGGSGAFLWTYRKWFHVLPKSNWNNFIAAIRAPRNFKLVFYNFCYYFLGQHRCWTETSIIQRFSFHKFVFTSTFSLPSLALPLFGHPWLDSREVNNETFFTSKRSCYQIYSIIIGWFMQYIYFLVKDGDTRNINIHKCLNVQCRHAAITPLNIFVWYSGMSKRLKLSGGLGGD